MSAILDQTRSRLLSGSLEGFTREDIFALAGQDSSFYNHFFFPKAFRQADSVLHKDLMAALEGPGRYVSIQVARGFAKTTHARACVSKRIAYAISRNILYVGKSEAHASRSVNWMRRVASFNHRWIDTFKIRKGEKWTDIELEFHSDLEDVDIRMMGVGVTGSIRGINWDDYRPDFIILDDIIDKEKVSTPEARKKITELVHSDIKEALEAETDNPLAKLILLETPLDSEDPGELAKRDREWINFRYPCWTRETEGLPVNQQVSSWEARYPSKTLQREKMAAIETGKYYLFAREKELKLTSPETSAFKADKIRFYDILPPREEMQVILAIDPVPPPTEARRLRGLSKHDFEVIAAVGSFRQDYYVLQVEAMRGHEPDWTIATLFNMVHRWRPRVVLVETVAYQATLAWLIRKAMQVQRQYFVIHEVDDKKKKTQRILDALQGPVNSGALWIGREMTTLFEQLTKYPDAIHDDELDAVSLAMEELQWGTLFDENELDELSYTKEERQMAALGAWRSAP